MAWHREIILFCIVSCNCFLNYISTADLSVTSIIKLVIALIISTLLITLGLIIYQRKYNIDKIEFTSIFQGSIRYNSYIFFAAGSPLLGSSGLSIVVLFLLTCLFLPIFYR